MRNRDGAARRFVPSPRGRPTRGQARALALLSPRYEIPLPTANGDGAANGNGADWSRIFGRRAPLCAEIGSGDGEALAQRALATPQADFVAIEIYRPGLGRLFTRLRGLGIDNVKAAPTDAVAALRLFFADGALAEIAVFFPDPWPKTRQQKTPLNRRIFRLFGGAQNRRRRIVSARHRRRRLRARNAPSRHRRARRKRRRIFAHRHARAPADQIRTARARIGRAPIFDFGVCQDPLTGGGLCFSSSASDEGLKYRASKNCKEAILSTGKVTSNFNSG